MQTRIDESIDSIKKKREEELAKTRKRLRTVRGLLGGALLALVTAGYFYYTANEQKKIALANTKKAEAETKKADSALNKFLAEQAAKKELEFKNLLSRAKIILEANGYPEAILNEMKALAADSLGANKALRAKWEEEIGFIKNEMKRIK